jgi:hypothetical protein
MVSTLAQQGAVGRRVLSLSDWKGWHLLGRRAQAFEDGYDTGTSSSGARTNVERESNPRGDQSGKNEFF